MASDLTTLFEAAGNTFQLNGFGGGPQADIQNGGEFGNAFGQENDELARIMRDLF